MLARTDDVTTWTTICVEPGARVRCLHRDDEPAVSLTLGRDEPATVEIALEMVGPVIEALTPYRRPDARR